MPANGTGGKRRRRVVKAPQVRRAEIIDAAQHLFLRKGYDKTTINDVIAATRLSKGAFYHHFHSKEDLLEAITERIAAAALDRVATRVADGPRDALARFNAVFDAIREWKLENMDELRAMFAASLKPENMVLYHRIAHASMTAMAPCLTEIIAQGMREGAFDVDDPAASADALLWLGFGRRAILAEAIEMAWRGEIDESVTMITRRLRAEERIADRLLGLPAGSINLIGSPDVLRAMLVAWRIPRARLNRGAIRSRQFVSR